MALELEITHSERADSFRAAITHIRSAVTLLNDAELFGAKDEAVRCAVALERQLGVFMETTDEQRASARVDSVTPDETQERFGLVPSVLPRWSARSFAIDADLYGAVVDRIEVRCFHCPSTAIVESSEQALLFFAEHRH